MARLTSAALCTLGIFFACSMSAAPSFAATPVSLSAADWEVIQGTGAVANVVEAVPGGGTPQVLSTTSTGGLGFEVRQTRPYGRRVEQRYLTVTLKSGASFALGVNVRGTNGAYFTLRYHSAPGAVTRTALDVLSYSLAGDYKDRYNSYQTYTLDLARDLKRLVPETDFQYARWISVRGAVNVGVLEFSNTFSYLAQSDTDQDGLNDLLEDTVSLTSPFLADSDGDGLRDGIEYGRACADALDAGVPSIPTADADGDGLDTRAELFLGTNCNLADDAALPTAYGWSIYAPAADGVVAPAGDGSIAVSHSAADPQALGAWIAGPWAPYSGHLNIARVKLAFKVKSAEKFDVRVRVRGSDGNQYSLMYPYAAGAPYLSGSEVRYPLRSLGYVVGGAAYTTVTRNLNADLAGLVPGVTVQKVLYVLARGRMNLKDIHLPLATAAPSMTGAHIAGSYTANSTISANVSASDADGDLVSYQYEWFVNDKVAPGETGATLAEAFAKDDQVFVRVTPTDGTLAGLPLNSNTVTIGNSVPVLTAATIAPVEAPAYASSATYYVDSWAGLFDADASDTPALLYQWYVNGLPVPAQTSRVLSDAYFNRGDTIYVQVTPTDGAAYGIPVNTPPLVVANTPPHIAALGLDPADPARGMPLTVRYLFSDADGDFEAPPRLRWYQNGVHRLDLEDSSVVSGGELYKGDRWRVEVEPFDGESYGQAVLSDESVIGNTRPTAGGISTVPATLQAGFSSAASPHEFSDVDGDALNYQFGWYRNGALTGSGLQSPTGYVYGDAASVAVRASDGTAFSDWAVLVVGVENTAPAVSNLSVAPAAPGPEDAVAVLYDYFDADGQADGGLEIQWYRNGDLAPEWNGAAQLPGGTLHVGETWLVMLRATDGVAWSAWHGAAVAVSDAAYEAGCTMADGDPDVSVVGDADLAALQPTFASLQPAPVRFENIARSAGVATPYETYGICWGDVNADGWPDLLSTNHSLADQLFVNNHDGTFAEEYALRVDTANMPPKFDTHACAWGDFDNDGDQDLFESVGGERGVGGTGNVVYRNGERLQNESVELGLAAIGTSGRTPLWLDADRDGLLDVVVANVAQTATQSTSLLFRQANGVFNALPGPDGTASLGSGTFGQVMELDGTPGPELALWDNGVRFFDVFPDHVTSMAVAGLGTMNLTRDVIVADFNGDLLPDIFDVRFNGTGNAVQWKPGASIEAHLNAKNSTAGFRFCTQSPVEVELWGSPRVEYYEVRVGAAGAQPKAVLDGDVAEFRLTLPFDGGGVRGLAIDPAGTPASGVYVGRSETDGAWSVLFSWAETKQRTINVVVRSAGLTQAPQLVNVSPVLGMPLENYLWIQTGNGSFAKGPPLPKPTSCRSAASGDFDNDMDLDVYLTCSTLIGDLPDAVLINDGAGIFTAITDGTVNSFADGNGDRAAVADFNRDGFLDLFVTQGNGPGPWIGPHRLLRNAGNGNHWLQLNLVGHLSNRDALGASVFLTAGGTTQRRDLAGGMGAYHQDDKPVHFGLRDNLLVDEIEIQWPSGIIQTLTNVAADQFLTIDEPF